VTHPQLRVTRSDLGGMRCGDAETPGLLHAVLFSNKNVLYSCINLIFGWANIWVLCFRPTGQSCGSCICVDVWLGEIKSPLYIYLYVFYCLPVIGG